MTQYNYDKTNKSIKDAAKVVAERSISEAADEIRSVVDTADTGVSVDVSRQQKGFTSTNVVITTISIETGKILDTCIMSK